MEDRFTILGQIDYERNQYSLQLFMLALGTTTITKEMVTFRTSRGETLLHFIATAWNEVFYFDDIKKARSLGAHSHSGEGTPSIYPWHQLLRQVIDVGSPLDALDFLSMTPFCIIAKYTRLRSRRQRLSPSFLPLSNYVWLQTLQESGVDLLEYGTREAVLGLKGRLKEWPSNFPHNKGARLIGFCYGPQPNDWRFWTAEPTDYLAGQFWAMVEKQNMLLHDCTVPGSWIEDDGEYDSESD